MRRDDVIFRYVVLCAAVLAAMLAGCVGRDPPAWVAVPTPVIVSGQAVTLRVALAENPRLPRMSAEQTGLMLASARQAAREHFDVDLRFADPVRIGVDRLFEIIPKPVVAARAESIYDIRNGSGNRGRVGQGLQKTIDASGNRLADLAAFVQPYAPGVRTDGIPGLAESLTEIMFHRLAEWKSVAAADARPVLDDSKYNEWVYWDSLGYGDLPYDLVVTNQLVVSAEYDGADIHSAMRGGLSLGTTAYSRSGKFGAYAMWSIFPFIDNSPVTLRLRGGERYTDDEAARLAGVLLAHEIGHLLFHYGHPFGRKACIMNPVPLLRFRETATGLDPAACRRGSNAQMKPGAVKLPFNMVWERAALRGG